MFNFLALSCNSHLHCCGRLERTHYGPRLRTTRCHRLFSVFRSSSQGTLATSRSIPHRFLACESDVTIRSPCWSGRRRIGELHGVCGGTFGNVAKLSRAAAKLLPSSRLPSLQRATSLSLITDSFGVDPVICTTFAVGTVRVDEL